MHTGQELENAVCWPCLQGLSIVVRGMALQGTPQKDLTASTLPDYREAWSEWLTKVFEGSRTDLLTLTFAPRSWERDAIGPTGPTRSRVSRAAHRLERLLTRSLVRPSFFIVREIGGWSGRAHLHSLLSSTDEFLIREGRALHEREGFTNLRKCAMAPSEYVAKYVSKSDSDFWLAGGPLFGTGGVLARCGEHDDRSYCADDCGDSVVQGAMK